MLEAPTANISCVASIELDLAEKKHNKVVYLKIVYLMQNVQLNLSYFEIRAQEKVYLMLITLKPDLLQELELEKVGF